MMVALSVSETSTNIYRTTYTAQLFAFHSSKAKKARCTCRDIVKLPMNEQADVCMTERVSSISIPPLPLLLLLLLLATIWSLGTGCKKEFLLVLVYLKRKYDVNYCLLLRRIALTLEENKITVNLVNSHRQKPAAPQHNVFSTGIDGILAAVLLPSDFCLGSGCQSQCYSPE
jgi:hypothetical protein